MQKQVIDKSISYVHVVIEINNMTEITKEIKEAFKKSLSKNIFYRTRVVYIELSNLCNYTLIHPQCPTSKLKKNIMPLKVIESIAKNLGKENYDKLLCPYSFSEPLIDPRLYTVLDIFKKYVPKAHYGFTTNGFFLYETILDDIVKKGVDHIIVTAYFPKEYERLKELKDKTKGKYPSLFFKIKKGFPLEKRMLDLYSIYTRKEPNKLTKECRAPYLNLYVNSYADISLCCNEWKSKITFGSLKEKSFREILLSDKMIDRYLNLRLNNRQKYFLCSRCYRYK